MGGRRQWRALTAVGTGLAIAGTAHAFFNLRRLRRPQPAGPVPRRVSLLIPARDEAARIGIALCSAMAQEDVPDLEILVLDDGSSDGTADAAVAAAAGDQRVSILRGPDTDPPPGWLGKPWACQRLARAAAGDLLIFLDADVALAPGAVSAVAAQLVADGADFGSPWPRQESVGVLARLVQPLQQWSWVTTLPLGAVASSSRTTLTAANGQFLIAECQAYWAVGGHAAVRDRVLEDVELARAMKSGGMRTALWDGSQLARCRMYDTAAELRAGYRKSLWAAFGPADAAPAVRATAAAGAIGLLALAGVVPSAAAVLGPTAGIRAVGLVGYAAAVAGRAAVARRTGSPVWPDSAAHPVSILALAALTADSHVARARGSTSWKGRAV